MRVTRIALLAALVLALGATIAYALSSVTLAWDASPDADVDNYNIYYGTNGSRVYTFRHVAGNVTQTTIENLVEGQGYWFTATAQVLASGLESDYCNEVFYQVPTNQVISGLSPPGLWVAQ